VRLFRTASQFTLALTASAAAVTFSTPSALAFPELVRHGYPSCVTCHVSPSGGGVLNGYGRELSREILSWPGAGPLKVKETESGFAHGVVGELPEWLALGGDARVVNYSLTGPNTDQQDWIPMQLDFEAAVTWKTLTLVGTLGQEFLRTRDPITRETQWDGNFTSRRHYLLWRPLDQLSVRTGLFMPSYGLNTAEHNLVIRRGIGFLDQGNETHNLEIGFLEGPWEIHATAIFGRRRGIDWGTTLRPGVELERGEAVMVSYFLAPRSKLGFSYYGGKTSDGSSRTVLGPFGILGLSEHAFIMGEMDFVSRKAETPAPGAIAQYLRADYEFVRGFHVYLLQQYLKSNLDRADSARIRYGLGVQMFPRPHFEIQADIQRDEAANNLAEGAFTLTTILFHYYL
jgi:hypothetical protein